MLKQFALAAAFAFAACGPSLAQGDGPTDAQIAHIAYTAGQIDVKAAEQALDKSKNEEVRQFAETMKRDHAAVNEKALALVKKLGVTPEDNPTSQSLEKAAEANHADLAKLDGAAFDKAYVRSEVAYHATVNGALATSAGSLNNSSSRARSPVRTHPSRNTQPWPFHSARLA